MPPNDLQATVHAILRLADSPELRKHLGDQSLELVKSKWSHEKVLNDFLGELKLSN